ncbi:MAG: glycosyltransferase family 4 protein [Candidatus Woesearchaeota archaeon]
MKKGTKTGKGNKAGKGSKGKKKLLIASDSFLPRWDGIARFLSEMIPRLKKDYDITIVAPDFRGSRVSMKGVSIVRIPVFGFSWGDYTPPKFRPGRIKELVKEHDLVFSQSIGPIGYLAMKHAKKKKKPVISFIHSIEWELVPKSASKLMFFARYIVRQLARWMYNKADLLIAPSIDTEKLFRENSISSPIKVIHLGIDTSRFTPAKDKKKAKEHAGVDKESTIIGFTGRVGREKDLGTLYRAFRALQSKHDNLKLMIVGKGLPLESIFDSMDDVIHIPVSNRIQDQLKAMDIFVLPSLTETSSLATMEAMACGLPVLATKVGHVEHYINDGKNGYHFERGDWQILAKKLDKLIERPELRRGIGRMARKTMETRYPLKRTVEGIRECLGRF